MHRKLPKTAYVALWLPLPSETFVFQEILGLSDLGMQIMPYSIYGPTGKKLSPKMRAYQRTVQTMGIKAIPDMLSAQAHWKRVRPELFKELWRTIPLRRWGTPETTGEALICFMAGFHLARMFQKDGIEHIHAPWARGPATAAWVASRLTGLPLTFAARAHDILPPDGALADKMRDALGVNAESGAAQKDVATAVPGQAHKVHQIYNSLTIDGDPDHVPDITPPYTMLALGRLVPKKGFNFLLEACGMLKAEDFPFRLTIAGSGGEEGRLRRLIKKLSLTNCVNMAGHITPDNVSRLMKAHQAFIMPSVTVRSGDRDGLPTVILEAMATGLPVVATDVGGIAEAVLHGETGLLCQEKDPQGLCDAIRHLFEDKDRALRMADAGRTKANALYNRETNAKLLADFMTGKS